MNGIATNGVGKPAELRSSDMPRSEAIERALINGDVSGLSPKERWDYYVMRCEAAGLDPRAQPFQYVSLQGRIVLYATKAAAEQLIAKRHLSVTIPSRGFNALAGIYEVTARVVYPDGQTIEDVGAVWIAEKTTGDALANAVLKAVTKAKRRAVLSACGLGEIDETEVDDIPGAVRLTAENSRILDRPDPPNAVHEAVNEPVAAHISAVRAMVLREIRATNDRWSATLAIEGKADQYKPICNEHQLAQGLISDWLEEGSIHPDDILGANGKRDRAKMGALLQVRHSSDPDGVTKHVRGYLLEKLEAAAADAGVELVRDGED